jgi:hypothetical protein
MHKITILLAALLCGGCDSTPPPDLGEFVDFNPPTSDVLGLPKFDDPSRRGFKITVTHQGSRTIYWCKIKPVEPTFSFTDMRSGETVHPPLGADVYADYWGMSSIQKSNYGQNLTELEVNPHDNQE